MKKIVLILTLAGMTGIHTASALTLRNEANQPSSFELTYRLSPPENGRHFRSHIQNMYARQVVTPNLSGLEAVSITNFRRIRLRAERDTSWDNPNKEIIYDGERFYSNE